MYVEVPFEARVQQLHKQAEWIAQNRGASCMLLRTGVSGHFVERVH
jgi:hypothetical protein